MAGYIFRRLLLLPVTLFFIVLVNFVVINLAPGEPSLMTEINMQGEAGRQEGRNALFGQDERYLQFREFFGLTLPILLNDWGFETKDQVLQELTGLAEKKRHGKELSSKEYNELRTLVGDKARFVLDHLLVIMNDDTLPFSVRALSFRYVLRGGRRFIREGHDLSASDRQDNAIISKNNLFLDELALLPLSTPEQLQQVAKEVTVWYHDHRAEVQKPKSTGEEIYQLLFETRFARYFSRVLRLDFGVTRLDPNRLVISEVVYRLKYSLALSVLPMFATIVLCLVFGMLMAIFKDSLFDRVGNFIFLLLYATPVFVVAPFLIEKIALHHTYPGTDIAFPIRGFSSPDSLYDTLTSWQRLGDIFRHITLPLISILYGSLAVQARLSRAIFLDTMGQEYIRTARAKGVSPLSLYIVHVGRNAAIPILTSVAASLGVILGGSVIVETIFEIHGFGKFFYDAIINRDYNVMMFSVLMGSFLTLLGYLVADLTYMWLDPRVNLEKAK